MARNYGRFTVLLSMSGISMSGIDIHCKPRYGDPRPVLRYVSQEQVRTVWDEQKEDWFFSIVDVVAVLTDSLRPRKY